ncbi:hypothetical protein GF322_01395, partial [Candidatus Dependentiae bacterium]|nr:hypothetical protein [Candidatus Dependentiae bacterium]
MLKKIRNIFLMMVPFFIVTSSSILSMHSDLTIPFEKKDNGGQYLQVRPIQQSSVKKRGFGAIDARFVSLEKLPPIGSYSHQQIETYLKNQWINLQHMYPTYELFAFNQFNLYQHQNFLNYIKTLPGYEGFIIRLKATFDHDKGLQKKLSELNNIDGFINKRHCLYGLVGSKKDQKAFRDFLEHERKRIESQPHISSTDETEPPRKKYKTEFCDTMPA